MKQKNKKIHLKYAYIIFIVILLITAVSIPSAWAIYQNGISSPMTTKFKLEYDTVFVRAKIITYWIDTNTNEMTAKTGWNLKNNITNDEWTKIDDYYYYNGTINRSDIENGGVPTNHELIDKNLTINELTNDDLNNIKYIPKYKIVYELIEAKEENNKISCEDAWKITYSQAGIPSKI